MPSLFISTATSSSQNQLRLIKRTDSWVLMPEGTIMIMKSDFRLNGGLTLLHLQRADAKNKFDLRTLGHWPFSQHWETNP